MIETLKHMHEYPITGAFEECYQASEIHDNPEAGEPDAKINLLGMQKE